MGKGPGVRRHPLALMAVGLAQNTAAFWVGGCRYAGVKGGHSNVVHETQKLLC